MKSFDIVEDAWIDVLMGDGTLQTCSLRCMLNDLHLIDRISESSAFTRRRVPVGRGLALYATVQIF